MNILIIGAGAREHALAWKLQQSPRVEKIFVAPGNAGTARLATNINLQSPVSSPQSPISNLQSLISNLHIALVVIGPETPLANGLADALRAQNIRVFGPNQNAAEIEASKAFAKDFMRRHNIPTARYETFTDFDDALRHVETIDYPMVIKASGLAAGKGVIIPETLDEARDALRQIMLERAFGAAGDAVVIEERLQGEEISVLAFSDGFTVKAMLPAQDHKRLLDGDLGPNTGGMGAYAPVNVAENFLDKITREILQPTIDGLRAEGRMFVGVLYAGLMCTQDGARVLEFNCRFGDPEAQALLPLLESDLLDVLEACVNGNLAQCEVKWKRGAAACVVLASGGYPNQYATGIPIHGLDAMQNRNAIIFHAGTKLQDTQVVTNGGRVLCVTGVGKNLGDALDTAYAALRPIHFEGMQFRRDIGKKDWRLETRDFALHAK
ncbi:MAG: phosphoribosylamine--glycine ligase [Chloroflexi bacterium UTCFX4]|jgi:phosphoribosylamine--glycine ligase|nr:MAG: phosphoribosylamine--glycine ligase [Chloroflexi bacterium UTCFX4]